MVGRAHLRRRPDDRAFVAADAWLEPVTRALLDAVAADVPGDLHTLAGEDDADQLALLAAAGYAVVRREDEFVIPVGPALAATAGPVPDGATIVPADEKESDRLARLDERLRQDVPGSDGWVNDPAEFREYTFAAALRPPALPGRRRRRRVRGAGPGLARQPGAAARAGRRCCAGTGGAGWPGRCCTPPSTPLAERGIELVSAEADADQRAVPGPARLPRRPPHRRLGRAPPSGRGLVAGRGRAGRPAGRAARRRPAPAGTGRTAPGSGGTRGRELPAERDLLLDHVVREGQRAAGGPGQVPPCTSASAIRRCNATAAGTVPNGIVTGRLQPRQSARNAAATSAADARVRRARRRRRPGRRRSTVPSALVQRDAADRERRTPGCRRRGE